MKTENIFLFIPYGGTRTTTPNPGHEGDMMAEHGGKVTEHEVKDILKANSIECPCKKKEPQHSSHSSERAWVGAYNPYGSALGKCNK